MNHFFQLKNILLVLLIIVVIMPIASEINIYDWKACNWSFRCLCRQCAWNKYRYDGQYPTVQERQECLKKLGRRHPLNKNEETERLKRNARKNELAQIRRSTTGEPKKKAVAVQTSEAITQTECVCLFL